MAIIDAEEAGETVVNASKPVQFYKAVRKSVTKRKRQKQSGKSPLWRWNLHAFNANMEAFWLRQDAFREKHQGDVQDPTSEDRKWYNGHRTRRLIKRTILKNMLNRDTNSKHFYFNFFLNAS